jgi:capsular exopolysaccharide synthesis family protein
VGKHKPLALKKIKLLDMTSGVAAESYRSLRTNLQFATGVADMKSVLVTSSQCDEGKTTVLANLGVAFAQAGSRVLLVDADLRRPCLHVGFEMSNLLGLTNLLIGGRPHEDGPVADYVCPTQHPNLWLLPAGTLPPNPSELLNSPRFQRLLTTLRTNFDYVFVDSPPLLAVSDALIISRSCDGILFVMNADGTPRQLAHKSLARLQQVNATLLGVVLNKFSHKTTNYAYKY